MNLRRWSASGAYATLCVLIPALVVNASLAGPNDASQRGRFHDLSAASGSQEHSDVSTLKNMDATRYPIDAGTNTGASSLSYSFDNAAPASPSVDGRTSSVNQKAQIAPDSFQTHIASKKRTFVLLLGVVTGIAHVVCANQYEYYANMMTGNTIRMATAVSKGDSKQGCYFGTVVLAYATGASLFRAVEVYGHSNSTLQIKEDERTAQALSRLIPISFSTFALSDVVSIMLPAPYRLHCLAVGFGMINAATQQALGVVTNAATGHITRLGTGVVDLAALLITQRRGQRQPRRVLSSVSSTILSAQFLFCLVLSIVIASKAYPLAIAQPWIGALPPIGTSFGTVYAALLTWYCCSLPNDPS